MASRIGQVVDDYVDYLQRERGLAKATLAHRRIFPRRFLEERFGDGPVHLSRLTARDLIHYIEGHVHEFGALYRAQMLLILKDFCRFLRLRGHVREDIASGIPRVPYWRPTRLPSYLERSETERLLSACDTATPKGMRDHAILLLLARLGLRAGEVRGLTLDDIDWEGGQITVCGKGNRRNRLPLPQDAGRALVQYLQHARPPCSSRHVFTLSDLGAPVIGDFLNHLEELRGNRPRSRNVRLAAIRSFFHYVAFEEPAYADLVQRVLAIPGKRWHRRLVSFLSRPETETLIDAPDRHTKGGRRDHALLLVAILTGLRASELTGLRCMDVVFGTGTHLRCHGKGRKERCVPLTKSVASVVKAWLAERAGKAEEPLFPNARGGVLSRDGVAYILKKHIDAAARRCPSLLTKRVSPHVLRHTAAVNLLQAGVDRAMIALWLGHESVETTQMYLHADLAYKEKILAKVATVTGRSITYRPDDQLLTFLNNL